MSWASSRPFTWGRAAVDERCGACGRPATGAGVCEPRPRLRRSRRSMGAPRGPRRSTPRASARGSASRTPCPPSAVGMIIALAVLRCTRTDVAARRGAPQARDARRRALLRPVRVGGAAGCRRLGGGRAPDGGRARVASAPGRRGPADRSERPRGERAARRRRGHPRRGGRLCDPRRPLREVEIAGLSDERLQSLRSQRRAARRRWSSPTRSRSGDTGQNGLAETVPLSARPGRRGRACCHCSFRPAVRSVPRGPAARYARKPCSTAWPRCTANGRECRRRCSSAPGDRTRSRVATSPAGLPET